MTPDPQHVPMFRIDVSADASAGPVDDELETGDLIVALLRQVVGNQERQNHLLKELNTHLSSAQRQRAHELGQWKEANPELSQCCRTAAETLSRVQTQFLQNLTEEIADNEESLVDGEFMLNEFVDRFGPRLAHLNGVLQVLSQLSSISSPPNAPGKQACSGKTVNPPTQLANRRGLTSHSPAWSVVVAIPPCLNDRDFVSTARLLRFPPSW